MKRITLNENNDRNKDYYKIKWSNNKNLRQIQNYEVVRQKSDLLNQNHNILNVDYIKESKLRKYMLSMLDSHSFFCNLESKKSKCPNLTCCFLHLPNIYPSSTILQESRYYLLSLLSQTFKVKDRSVNRSFGFLPFLLH